MKTLAALCDILSCERGDLIECFVVERARTKSAAAGGSKVADINDSPRPGRARITDTEPEGLRALRSATTDHRQLARRAGVQQLLLLRRQPLGLSAGALPILACVRIGISGKGGVGKTTVSAVVSRAMARLGHRVVAIDCDSDANLGANIGLGEDGAARLRPFLDQSGPIRRLPEGLHASELLAEYGQPGPDGVTILLGARIERAGSGCTGSAHIKVRDFLEQVDDEIPEIVVVADMEAGLEHLSWAGGTLRHVDLLLVVVQPSPKVLLTATRTDRLAIDLGIPRVAFVANCAAERHRDQLEAFARERGRELVGWIPEDEAVKRADKVGRCILDTDPGAPSVIAIQTLAGVLAAELSSSHR